MDELNKSASLYKAKEHIEEATSQILEEGKKRANEIYEEGIKKATQVEDNIEEMVDDLIWKIQANPLASVLIAGAVGYLLAKIMKK